MVRIEGNLKTITLDESTVRQVWVQAQAIDARDTTVIVPETKKISVMDGRVSFEAAPNSLGTIVLVYGDTTPNTPIPFYATKADTQSLGDAINAAKMEKNSSASEIQTLIDSALEAVESSRDNAASARTSAAEAANSESSARNSAEAAANSAASANDSATSAGESQSAAALSASNAAASEQNAKESEDNAASSAESAKASEDAAEGHATTAKNQADIAVASAEGASQSEVLALGYRDEARNYAESANVGLQDNTVSEAKLTPELSTKINAGLTHVIGDVSGLREELDNKAAVGHTHATTDLVGIDGVTDTVNNSSAANRLVRADGAGRVYASTPEQTGQVANKGYVDASSYEYTTVAYRGFIGKGSSTYPGFVTSLYKDDYSKATFATNKGTTIILNERGLYRFDVSVSSRDNATNQEQVTPFLYMGLKISGDTLTYLTFAPGTGYVYNSAMQIQDRLAAGGSFVRGVYQGGSEINLGVNKQSSTSTFDVHLIITRLGDARETKVS